MHYLYIIPARGGSKGIPHKNILPFNGKPLLCYAIDIARNFAEDGDICVSTEDVDFIKLIEGYGLHVPYRRPDYLAGDTCGTYDVIIDCLDYFESRCVKYDAVVLLQPTSPFRRPDDVKAALNIFERGSYEMVVTVNEAKTNPYYNCYKENKGYLEPLFENLNIVRRQDAPKVYECNGAVYVISVDALRKKDMGTFTKIGFVPMDLIHSVDLDSMLDWNYAEFLVKNGFVK